MCDPNCIGGGGGGAAAANAVMFSYKQLFSSYVGETGLATKPAKSSPTTSTSLDRFNLRRTESATADDSDPPG